STAVFAFPGGTVPAVLPRGLEAGEARRPHNRASLAELFLHMLRYYADFPYGAMAVSVRAGARVPVAECRAARAHKNDPHQWKLLCVEGEAFVLLFQPG
ncbi:poly(A) RNA polymerase gld-2 homolog A-like, partial [Ostrinia furnacalis]|uniref:poly(A) RNA polymerase gld-2 homolog A-like n=1 Tax=Ostrinia furnacalis TaxID=93504 RepID=UPI00103A7894